MSAGLRTWLPGVALLAVALLGPTILPLPPTRWGNSAAPSPAPLRMPDAADPELAAFVTDLISGRDGAATPSHPALLGDAGPTYAALRSEGLRLAEAWGTGPTRGDAVREAVELARGALADGERETIDTVELSIGSAVDPIDGPGERGRLTNVHRGVLGLEVRHGKRVERFAPTQMIAGNLGFTDALDRAAASMRVSTEALESGATLGTFAADQALVRIGSPDLTWLFRGNEVVPADAVTAESTATLASSLGDWLTRNVHDDGRMTYKYWPSRGEESTANNTIRQWMATVALGRTAATRGEEALVELVRRNIDYNLAEFYELEGDLGLIVEADGDVKLGAVGLAALALIEHPDRADFADEEAALRRTVDALWSPDGSFRTFLRPEGRNDNQNFYPGEALLLWATLMQEDADPELLDRFMRSFDYYRAWHRDQRNPAFVPWHTQAYVLAWEVTGNDDLRSFVFEMNDWLLDFQQWDGVEYPDLSGRFYDPSRPNFGAPHASSDGVYLEGLAAAYRLAVAVDDHARADRYRLAIVRSLRNVMQLHFGDEVDLYYVSRADPVAGGVRTTPYDNEIRVDNVQHNLMGILEVIEHFPREAYASR